MKLHKDGTIEGTPQEVAEYNRLQEHGKLMKEQIEKRFHEPNPIHPFVAAGTIYRSDPTERWDRRIRLESGGTI